PVNCSASPKILLVDDVLSDLRLLMEMLASQQLHIVVAFNGNDGYQKAVMNRPELILLDVGMPGADGFAVCRLLKANPATRDIPVIFLTGANQPEQRVEGFALGAVDYVIKPFNEKEVLARVSLHLNIARRLNATGSRMPAEDGNKGESPNAVLVRAARGYLADCLSDPPSPAQLARLLGTNETRLNAAFRQEMNLPVFGYVREERMRQARMLLADTNIPIATIGEHIGYPNPSNFATAFRQRFGTSPREFRLSLEERAKNGMRDAPDAP
ncbi:MAG TPA: DNA-binding response regulator, partial [Gallionella sp.]|nr:DNA-binding response regulator [Gallionella sp.]